MCTILDSQGNMEFAEKHPSDTHCDRWVDIGISGHDHSPGLVNEYVVMTCRVMFHNWFEPTLGGDTHGNRHRR